MLSGPATDRSNLTASVESDVITKILLLFMEAPVRIEIPASSQRTETENCFSPVQTPTRARTIHSVFDQIPTCAFDDASGDRQSHFQILVVLHVLLVFEQVIRTGVDSLSRGLVESMKCGAAAHTGGHSSRCSMAAVPRAAA